MKNKEYRPEKESVKEEKIPVAPDDKPIEEVIPEQNEVNTIPADKEEELITVAGVVSGCARLNVRANPSLEAEVLMILDKGDEVTIIPYLKSDEWYKVIGHEGVTGYCMSKFITEQ